MLYRKNMKQILVRHYYFQYYHYYYYVLFHKQILLYELKNTIDIIRGRNEEKRK